jgi:L-amino acid N-acyltransferase YncA
MHIRPATPDDLPAINDIYNHYVFHSTCTYQETPEPIESRRAWFTHHGQNHPIIVAADSHKIVGWASLSPYHARSAYRRTVENSVYVDHRHHRHGIGCALLTELISLATSQGHRTIIAGIDADQTASIVLHQKFAFQKVAHLRQVGYKFNRWLDVIYMQLMLPS